MKRCPFCGSANLSEDWSSRDGRHGEVTDWWVTCLDCGGGGPVKSSLYDAREAFGAERVSIEALRTERDAAVARAEAAEAALAAARAEGAAAERAQVVAFCNATAYHGARDAIAAGLHWQRD